MFCLATHKKAGRVLGNTGEYRSLFRKTQSARGGVFVPIFFDIPLDNSIDGVLSLCLSELTYPPAATFLLRRKSSNHNRSMMLQPSPSTLVVLMERNSLNTQTDSLLLLLLLLLFLFFFDLLMWIS